MRAAADGGRCLYIIAPGEGRSSPFDRCVLVELPHDLAGYGMLRAFTAIRDPAGAAIINRLAAGRFDDFRGARSRDPARRCSCNRRNSNSTGKLEACGRIFSDGNCSTTPICRLPGTHHIEMYLSTKPLNFA